HRRFVAGGFDAENGATDSGRLVSRALQNKAMKHRIYCLILTGTCAFCTCPQPATESDCLMPSVRVKENEPFEVALRRFKRSCEKAGVVTEVRRREFFEKPSQVRKRKRAAAVKRYAKRLQRAQQRFTRQY